MPFLSSVILRDVFANRPSASSGGRIFFSSDTNRTYRDNGSSWDEISAQGLGELVTAQTGTSYTFGHNDGGGLTTFANGSANAATLPQPTGSSGNFPNGWEVDILNVGAGALTVTPTSSTLAGLASQVFLTGQGAKLISDGTNWQALFFTGSFAAPYDLISSFIGNPSAGQSVFLFTFPRPVTFPANFAGASGTVGANPSGTATYTVNKNGSSIGTVAISSIGAFTFTTTSGTAKSFAIGDRMTITAPNPQVSGLADVAFTISGTR